MSVGLREPGMDHPHHPYSALPDRPTLAWPGVKPVAVVPIVTLEHFDDVESDWPQSKSLSGGVGDRATPNIARWSHREYGARVGVFRILDALEAHGFPITVAIDGMTAATRPWLVEHLRQRNAVFIAHGWAVNRMIHDGMSEAEERAYVEKSTGQLADVGIQPTGWFGPEYGESRRTPAIVAAAGFRYICDWCNDEQPFDMTVPAGRLTAFPLMADLDDQFALLTRGIRLDSYGQMITDAFDQLAKEGQETGRLLAWAVRPFISGQPFRIGVFEQVLEHIQRSGAAWRPHSEELIEAWRAGARHEGDQ